MAIKVFMKNLGDAVWKNVTDKTVNSSFLIREGFKSIGKRIDYTKLTITYKAADLASAAVFHTTPKQVKVYDGTVKVFEGYTEGSASVQTSRTSSDAWVRLTAYPYIKKLEEARNSREILITDAWASRPSDPLKSVLHVLWNSMLNSIDYRFRELINENYAISIPEINEYRAIYRLEADSSLSDEFSAIVGEFGYATWLDAFVVRFSKPYADDTRIPVTIGYTDVMDNPSIKSAPYIDSSRPVVNLSKIIERNVQEIYAMDVDENDGRFDGVENIPIGGSYPEEGTATIQYDIKDASDTLEFYYAVNPVVTVNAFKHSNPPVDASLTQTVWNIGATGAEIKLTNENDAMVTINQIKVVADRVFVIDRSTEIAADVEGKRTDYNPKFISSIEAGKDYLESIVCENRASLASLTFSSEKNLGIRPNSIIEVGDIPADYIVLMVEKDIVKKVTKYECALIDLDEFSVSVKRQLVDSRGNDAKVFQLKASSYSYIINRRVTTPTQITISVDVQGYQGDPVIVCDTESSYYNDGVLTIPSDTPHDSIMLSATLDGAEPQSIVVTGIDMTGTGTFVGTVYGKTPVNIRDGGKLVNGDYFVAGDTFVENDRSYVKGEAYVYMASTWIDLTSSDPEYVQKMMTCLGGTLQSGTSLESATILSAWVRRFAAQEAVIGELRAQLAVLTDVRIEGKSEFKGEITSTAFSTTVAEPGSNPITIGLAAENYWDYPTMERLLDSIIPSDGYYDVGGNYAQIRYGTRRLSLWSADGAKAATRTVRVTVPRTQTLSVHVYQGRVYLDGAKVIDWNATKDKWYTLDVRAGQTLVLDAYWSNDSFVDTYDVPEDFSTKYSFFDANGNHITSIGSGINVGTGPTVSYGGNSVSAPTVHKASSIPGGSGGGQVNAGGKITLTRYDGSESIANKDIYSVTWKNGEEITVITKDMKPYVIRSSDHFLELSVSFTVMTKIDSVSAVTILPKSNSSDIGSDGSKFNAGHFKEVYADALMIGGNGLPSGNEGSIHLPNGIVLKWKFYAAQGGSSARELSWSFAEAFPSRCVFAFASQMSPYTSGDKYYGYMMKNSRTGVSFASWSAYPYYCFAIGY